MTNFLQFDASKNNMMSDASYSASTFLARGAVTGVASSSAHNKLFYQISTMMAAIAQMMETKGYTISDTSLATLITELSHIMTEADMSSYATIASLADYIKKEAVVIKTSSYIILTTDMYKTLEANSSGTLTFTLPAYTTVANGAWIKIKNIGSGTLTLSGLIDGAASKDLNQYEEITVYSDGVSWRGKVIASTSALSFDASLTENGYQKLPSGLIMQWGKYAPVGGIVGDAGYAISFAVEFPTDCLSVNAISINTYADPYNHQIVPEIISFNKTECTLYLNYFSGTNSTDGFYWQAIGY